MKADAFHSAHDALCDFSQIADPIQTITCVTMVSSLISPVGDYLLWMM